MTSETPLTKAERTSGKTIAGGGTEDFEQLLRGGDPGHAVFRYPVYDSDRPPSIPERAGSGGGTSKPGFHTDSRHYQRSWHGILLDAWLMMSIDL